LAGECQFYFADIARTTVFMPVENARIMDSIAREMALP
jgi:hypothetical protein